MTAVETDEQVKVKIERNERAAMMGGGLVFAGLVGEVILAASFYHDEGFIGRWGPVIADVSVAAGVFTEILFAYFARKKGEALQRRSDERVAEANRRAQDAAKEAAEARERTAEIERMTAWRRISLQAQKAISDRIQPNATHFDVLIQHLSNDTETYMFARDIASVFQAAGVHKLRIGPNSYPFHNMFGLYVASELEAFMKPITDAFTNDGVRHWSRTMDLSKILGSAEPAPNIYIYVGPKIPE